MAAQDRKRVRHYRSRHNGLPHMEQQPKHLRILKGSRMKYIWALVLLSLCTAVSTRAESPDASCCSITAVPEPDSPTMLVVTITNVSDPLVMVVQTFPEKDVALRLVSASGEEAERTEFGKRILNSRHDRRVFRHIAKGESESETVDVAKVFDLKPGLFTASGYRV